MNNKSDLAYQKIKQKIITGEMIPLSEVSEDKLQKELNISRTPIREAVQKLEKDHFVLIYPRRGTIVSDITLDLINSIYEIRLLNEPYVARSACRYISPEWAEGMLQSFKKELKESGTKQHRDHYIELDRELHDMLTRYTNNLLFKDMFRIVNDHTHRIRIFTSQRNLNYEKSIDEHIQILEAVKSRDQQRVEEAVKQHIKTAKTEAFQYYNE